MSSDATVCFIEPSSKNRTELIQIDLYAVHCTIQCNSISSFIFRSHCTQMTSRVLRLPLIRRQHAVVRDRATPHCICCGVPVLQARTAHGLGARTGTGTSTRITV